MFKNMKLSAKLIGGFGVILVLLLGVTALYHFAIRSSCTEFSVLMDTQVAMANHAAKAESLMLQCRRDEKDFLLRKDLKYLDQLEETVSQLKTETALIVTLAQASGNEQAANNASQIISYADDYAKNFADLVSAWEIKGLDYKSGLQGQFRAAAGDLVKATEHHEITDVRFAFLQLRRYEKDYVRTHSDKYRDKFLSALATYDSLLKDSVCKEESQKAQQDALIQYSKAFQTYLSTGDSEELKNQNYEAMRAAATDMETAIEQVYIPATQTLVLDIRKNEKDYMLRGDLKYAESTHKAIEKLLTAYRSSGTVYDSCVVAVEKVAAEYKTAFDGLVAKDKEIAELTAAMREAVHKIEPLVEATHSASMESAETKTESTISTANSLAVMAVSIAIGAIVMGMVLAIMITRSVTKPINRIIASLTEGAAQIASASGQVSSASQSLAEGATEQAAGLEETSSSLEEMSSMTRQNADNAQQANTLASQARKTADNGAESMTRMNTAILDIPRQS